MLPKIIVLATSKGGAGKSTLARSLACHWVHSGLLPAVIDADPQGSIIGRHDPNGPLKNMPVLSSPEENVDSFINELKLHKTPILVDTGGFRNRTTIKALITCDLALIPLKPSADDMTAAIETYQLIQELNETPERSGHPIKARLVITMSQQGTIIARHVREELKSIGLPILKAELYHRVSYPEAAINGLAPSITDPEGAAARDIASIVAEIVSLG